MMDEALFITIYEREGKNSEETQQRDRKIDAFVRVFNRMQAPLYKDSLQYHMRRLLEDKEELLRLKPLLECVFEAHKLVQAQSKAFVNTPSLHITEARRPVYAIKQRHFRILGVLGTLHSSLSREIELNAIDEAIAYCEEAFGVKEQLLIELRKDAKNMLIAMFDVFILFSHLFKEAPSVVIDHILGHFYLRLIFQGVVLIKGHIIKVAFDALRKRTALYRF